MTVASVRSANRAARVAELSLLAGQRPLLVPSRTEDTAVKVGFHDDVWFSVPGGHGIASAKEGGVYFVISVRNVGTGIAVLHGWHVYPDLQLGPDIEIVPTPLDDFTRLTRDLYVAPGDVGFWQGAFRDQTSDRYRSARRQVEPLLIEAMEGRRQLADVDEKFTKGAGERRKRGNFFRDRGGLLVAFGSLDELQFLKVARKSGLRDAEALRGETAAKVVLVGDALAGDEAEDLAVTECFANAHDSNIIHRHV